MSRRRLRDAESALAAPAAGRFGDGELAGLPDPARRFLRAAIAPGTPIATTARIRMRGEIRLRGWTRFTATEVIAPHAGFLWAARAGAIGGFDRYADGEGELRWKLLGLVPVVGASGPDVARSAAGRVAGEAVWVPTALLPRFGVQWAAPSDRRLDARLRLGGHETEVHYALGEDGLVRAVWLDRFGDPDRTGTPGLHPFGMEAEAQRTFGGVTVPSTGRAGWHFGTDRWADGIFFRYELTELELVSAG